MTTRVIIYIDGFNLFHAIDEIGDPDIKWINLYDLSSQIIRPQFGEELVSVKYFTAYATWKQQAYRRHERYVKSLEDTGVTTILGKFKRKNVRCKASCGQIFSTHEEKETDVNIGIHLVADAICDRFDRAIIISADTDMAPAIAFARREAPNKKIDAVAPPRRKGRARDLNPLFEITPGKLKRTLFPDHIKEYIASNHRSKK